ncbi:hypothetical protein [Tropicimonas isoalkanivorans]|uniref:Uncharacterized protein n=1 Tax=Tropicimonas isoalkanivorans TaxID=441112 RepID=A0A1I1QBK4_9RHOB|nr:hypothetical protein [Tropicimonas isoalkanivorans]SFD19397.1 hypothetical protein SAMN04488094_11955 [Tropicimonas isoalkanivorans]
MKLIIFATAILGATPAVAVNADSFTRRPDLAEKYADILAADSFGEKNIVPTTVTVFSTGEPVPICATFDNTYEVEKIGDSVSAGTISVADADELLRQLDCALALPGSWGHAVRAYINTALLVDFIYIVGVELEALENVDSTYWIDAKYLRDWSTSEPAQPLAIQPFE